MNDCTYSRYADRRTRDYIARPRAPRLASLDRDKALFHTSTSAGSRRRAGRRGRLDRVLPAGPRPQPLRRQGAPRRRQAGVRQPHARMAADRGGVAPAAASDRRRARAGEPLLPHGAVCVARLNRVPRDLDLRGCPADSSGHRIGGRRLHLRGAARPEPEPVVSPHHADDRAPAAGDDSARRALARRVGRIRSRHGAAEARRRPVCGDVDSLRGLAGDRRGGSFDALVRRGCRLAIWPALAVVIFLVNSRITVGAWFVSEGFYVPDPTYAHQPLRTLLGIWWGTHRLSGYLIEAIALAGAGAIAWRALARKEDSALMVT